MILGRDGTWALVETAPLARLLEELKLAAGFAPAYFFENVDETLERAERVLAELHE